MSENKVNLREDPSGARIAKINHQVDTEVVNIMNDLAIVASDLDALMEVLKDRMIQSTDASYPIALARLGELRMDTIKKRLDVLKMLVNDKGLEVSSKKKAPVTDLESILSGAALGAALGARVGNNLSMNSNAQQYEDVETVDVGNEEFIVETEHIGDPGKSVSDLLKGE